MAAEANVFLAEISEMPSANFQMDVDEAPRERGSKRGADEMSATSETHKRARIGEFSSCSQSADLQLTRKEQKPAPLKRSVVYFIRPWNVADF